MRQSPGGPVIGTLRPYQHVIILYGRQVVDGLVWIEVVDDEGRRGWIPEAYVFPFTPTPSPTSAPVLSATPTARTAEDTPAP